MPAKVPITEIGSANEGMTVAERLRRKRKITRTTRAPASNRLNCTSETAIGDDLLAKSCRVIDLAIGLDVLRRLRALEASSRQIDVPGLGGGLNFVESDAAGGKLIRVELDAQREFLRAINIDLGNAWQ